MLDVQDLSLGVSRFVINTKRAHKVYPMENSNGVKKPRIPGWIKKVVPFLVSAFILYYYFADQDWAELRNATRHVNIPLAFFAVIIPQLIFWCFEVLITERHFTWYYKPFPWRSYIWARGAMYLLMMINTTLGGGGIVLYLQRKTRISWSRLMGIGLFRLGLTFWAIQVLMIPATLAMHHYGVTEKVNVNMWIWWGVLITSMVWLVTSWLMWHHGIKTGFEKFIVRDPSTELWAAFRRSTRGQWLLTGLMGVTPVFIYLVGFWVLAVAFDIRVPFLEYIVVAPLVFLIIDMPVAFAGFGTTTMAWFFFFGDYGDKTTIAGFTLFLPVARVAVRAVIGGVSLPFALDDIGGLMKQTKRGSE